MKNYAVRLLKKIAGVCLIILGVLGLFLPFLQGIIFIIAGAFLLDNDYILKKVRKLQDYFRKKQTQRKKKHR